MEDVAPQGPARRRAPLWRPRRDIGSRSMQHSHFGASRPERRVASRRSCGKCHAASGLAAGAAPLSRAARACAHTLAERLEMSPGAIRRDLEQGDKA
jgi:hypothetical protein